MQEGCWDLEGLLWEHSPLFVHKEPRGALLCPRGLRLSCVQSCASPRAGSGGWQRCPSPLQTDFSFNLLSVPSLQTSSRCNRDLPLMLIEGDA